MSGHYVACLSVPMKLMHSKRIAKAPEIVPRSNNALGREAPKIAHLRSHPVDKRQQKNAGDSEDGAQDLHGVAGIIMRPPPVGRHFISSAIAAQTG